VQQLTGAATPTSRRTIELEIATPDDWRVLRLLSFYRLALVGILLGLLAADYTPQILSAIKPAWYRWTCLGYAAASLLLAGLVQSQRPRISWQAYLNFLVDLAATATLVYASGGVDDGLGTLLLIPAVVCALVLTPRMAVTLAAVGTLGMFAEEIVRQAGHPMDGAGFTSTGVLGLILFGTSIAANTVAQRARKSEALALRMGSDFANLSRLNEVILESMHTGVLVLDDSLRIANLNAAARELLRTTSRAEGRSLELECAPLAERLRWWLASKEGNDAPLSLGANMPEVIARLSRLGTGAQAPILVVLEDASRLREQAQQIKLAALGRLSASIAHEIRNPLAAISHAGQLMYEEPEISADNRRLLAMIHRHTDRIDKIVNDVMALSRREAAQPVAIPLAPWLEDTIALYREGHAKTQRPIELADISRSVRVRFDPRHLQQLMFNLWDNAFHHGARDGSIAQVRVSVGVERGGRPWLDVSDNGPGIAPEVVDKIFEPFFTTAHGGTGLGLYLARELCEFNQARMSYQRRPVGACFRISFTPGGIE
jgi:two-component system sensor histidine kinase PilS (NtrC family)